MAEHAFKTIGKDVRENRLKPVVLLHGKEQYLVDWACRMLIEKFVNPVTKEMDCSVFDASDAEAEDIIAACETIAMLSEKRVVLVKFGKEKIRFDEDMLAEYLKDVPDETMLILSFEAEGKAKKVFNEAGKVGSVYEFGILDERTLKGFIGKRLKAEGMDMTPQALKAFVSMSGYFNKESDYTIYHLVNDLSKLAAYAETDVISKEEVEELMEQSAERYIFALIEAVSRGRKDEAFRKMDDLINGGTSIFSIIGLLAGQFELMLSIKQLKAKGINRNELPEILNAHEYRVKKVIPIVDRYDEARLKKILLRAYEMESDIKNGNLTERLALEMFMASM